MNSNEIRDTLFPHEKTIRELNARYLALEEKYLWLREIGVMLEKGGVSLYLRGDALDQFFANGCEFPEPVKAIEPTKQTRKKTNGENT